MFIQGSTVAHSRHGIGTIRAIEEREILGAKAVFVTMHFEREGLNLTVGQKSLESQTRDVLTEAEGEKIMQHLASSEEALSGDWKTRNKGNQERLTSGDPYQLCEIIRGLGALKKKRGELSNTDRAQLARALDLLSEELTIALEKTSTEEMLAEIIVASHIAVPA
jgi:CarD family transcriptional regulator